MLQLLVQAWAVATLTAFTLLLVVISAQTCRRLVRQGLVRWRGAHGVTPRRPGLRAALHVPVAPRGAR